MIVTVLFINNKQPTLDFATKTLAKVQKLAGLLRLISGNPTALGIVNNFFEAIISIGVVEHSRSGPESILNEKFRIVKARGLLLISVPYFNPLRLWRAGCRAYKDDVSNLDFYQSADTRQEFIDLLAMSGFEVKTIHSKSHLNTLTQGLSWLGQAPVFLKKFILRTSKYVPL